MKSQSVHIQMKATEQNFAVGLFAVQLGSSFKCVDEILECDHSSESYCRSSTFMWIFHYAVQSGSNF